MNKKVPDGFVRIEVMEFNRESYDSLRDFTNQRANRLAIPRCIDGKAICYVETSDGDVIIEEGYCVAKSEDGRLFVMDKQYINKHAKSW